MSHEITLSETKPSVISCHTLLDYQATMEEKKIEKVIRLKKEALMQSNNYATLLSEIQEPDRAMSVFQKLPRIIKNYNSDHCLDYAQIQKFIGNICLITDDISKAIIHF